MLLTDLVETSAAVASTRSRTAKIAALSSALRTAAADEVETATSYLSGVLRQRRTGLGWRTLAVLPSPAPEAVLTLDEVHRSFAAISAITGAGSAARRSALVDRLFGRATAAEQQFLRRLATGELRQGALDGLMLEAIADASGLSPTRVRRASMLCGATIPVAVAALAGGADALAQFRLRAGQPLRPMLASSAPDLSDALTKVAPDGQPVAVDCKLDGIRIQVHKHSDRVKIYTRSLDDITDRLPEVAEAVATLPSATLVLDGEAIALRPDGRPRPFQETGSRTANRGEVSTLRADVPVSAYFFDVLHVDGEDVLDLPAETRFQRLAQTVPQDLIVPRVITGELDQAQQFFDEVVARGHEGVVVKDLSAPYDAGRRGGAWVKVKPRHTLDLVVLAAEWGSGRRQGWLSNIHLGARDAESGDFVMLGKTFKGMTDDVLRWQTERFLTLQAHRDGHVVYVRPEQVVEVAFDGIQTSSRYPAGLTLRFARVVRYRDDKAAADADTVDMVRSLHHP